MGEAVHQAGQLGCPNPSANLAGVIQALCLCRYDRPALFFGKIRLCINILQEWFLKISWKRLQGDIIGGITAAVVALPLRWLLELPVGRVPRPAYMHQFSEDLPRLYLAGVVYRLPALQAQ